MSRRLGPRWVTVLCVAAAIVLTVGTAMSYGRRVLFDTDAFTQRAVGVMHDDAVSNRLAVVLSRQAVEASSPDLVAARPLVEGAIGRAISSGAADPILRVALAEMHRGLFSATSGPLRLNARDLLILARGVIGAARPDVASSLATGEAAATVKVGDADSSRWVRIATRVRWLGWLLPAIALALLAAATLLARDRRRASFGVGIALAAAGTLVVFLTAIARTLVLGRFDGESRDVAAATWHGLIGELGRWGLVLMAAGALIAAAATSLIPALDVGSGLARLRAVGTARLTGRAGTALTIGRAVVAIGVGALAVLDWEATARLVLSLAGVVLTVWGVSELLRLDHGAGGRAAGGALRPQGRRVTAQVIGGLGAAGLLGLGIVALFTGAGQAAPAPVPEPCNGHSELCDRRLDQVAMVASHNAMSAASDPGWFNAHHYNPLIQQLNAGARGLLIDTHLGQETARGGFDGTALVQTDLGGATRTQIETEIGSESLAAAERLSGRIIYGEKVTKPRLYLCHGLCEIGATDARSEYRRIADWLDDHPDQVIVIVIQDDASIDEDVAALTESGLAARAWPQRLSATSPLPTLRQMIDAGKTALIMHESASDAGPPWYQNAYAITQETAYAFPSVPAISAAASCAPNRGVKGAPLFLLNHWLDKQPVQASQASAVNVAPVLGARAKLCQKERGRLPNLVAINFVELGDARAVVDELNGVATVPSVAGG